MVNTSLLYIFIIYYTLKVTLTQREPESGQPQGIKLY